MDVIDKPRDDIAHSLCNLHPAMSILSTKQQTFASVQHVQIVVNEGATAFEFLVQSDYEGELGAVLVRHKFLLIVCVVSNDEQIVNK